MGCQTLHTCSPARRPRPVSRSYRPPPGTRQWFAGAEGVFRLDGDRWTAVGTFAEPVQFSGAFAFDPINPAVLYAGTIGRSVLRLDLGER